MDTLYDNSPVFREVEIAGDFRVEVLNGNTDPGRYHLTIFNEIGYYFSRPADGNGKPDPLGFCIDGGIDTDQFPVDIQQGSAAVTRVNGGVNLYEIMVNTVIGSDTALRCTNDAGGDGMRKTERIADGNHRFTDHQIVAAAHGDGGKGGFRGDPENRKV